MPEPTDPIKYILQGKELKNMTEDEWNALTSAYSAMTEAQGPLQAEYLKRQNNPNFVGYIPENEMSSISPQYQDAMSNWLTYAKKYGIGDPSLIGSSEITGSSTGAYGTQNAQYANLLSPGNSPVSFQRVEPTIPKINTRGYNVNPNVNMGQKQVIGQDPVTGRPLYGNVSTEQTTLQGGVDPTDASIMYDEQGNLLQPTTGGAVGGSGESFVFPEAEDIINNAYGGRRKRSRYEHGGPHFSLTSENRPITEGSLTNQMLNHQFQDLEFANYSTNKHTLGLNTPLGNRPLDKTNWYPNLNASVSLNNRQTRHGRPGTPNSAGLDVSYHVDDWESKPGIEGDLNFELQNLKQLRNRNFTTDNRVNLGAQYVNNSLEPYIGGDFGLGYDFGNRRNPKGNIKGGLNVRMPFRNTKGVDLGYSSTGSHRVLGRDRGFDQIGSGAMNISPYLEGSYNIGDNLSLSGKAGYNLLGSQPSFEAGLKYNIGDKIRKNKKYSHGGPPPHPEDLDVVRNQSNKEVLSKQLTSLNNPNLIENTYTSEDISDPYALFEKIRTTSIEEDAGNPSQLNTTFLTKAGVEPLNIRSEDYSGEITGQGEKQVYEEGNFNPYLSNNPFQGPTTSAVPESIPTFPYGGQPQQQGGQGDQLQQIIMAYAQISNQDPQTIMQQLEQSPPEQQQQIIQQMAMAVQGGGQGNVPQRGMGGFGNIIQGFTSGFKKAGEGNKGGGQGMGNFIGGMFEGFGMPGVGDQFSGGHSPEGSTTASTGNMYQEHKKSSGEYDKDGNLIDTSQSSGASALEGLKAFKDMSGMGGDFMGGNLGGVGEGTLSEADWGELNIQNDPTFQASPEGYQSYIGDVNPNYSPALEGIGDKTNPMMQQFGSFLGGSGGEGGSGSGLGGIFNFAGGEGGTGGFDLSSILGLLGSGGEGEGGKLKELLSDPKVLELIQQYGGNLGNQAYGGPRNPYACGGSKPMLPYKRAMGGPREDNTNVYRGATHEQGGIPIGYDYGGKVNPNKIEVENNEVSWIDPNGGEEYIFSDRIEFKSGGKTKRKK